MKAFDACFHNVLNTPVPQDRTKAQKPMFCCGCPDLSNAAITHQDAIVKEMHTAQDVDSTKVNLETNIGQIPSHNLQLGDRSAEWIELPTALKGPVHVSAIAKCRFRQRSLISGNSSITSIFPWRPWQLPTLIRSNPTLRIRHLAQFQCGQISDQEAARRTLQAW